MLRQNKQEFVIKDLEKKILSRLLKPGDKLPSERELQEKFNIGRGTLRESFRTLQQMGLIEIRKGAKGGAFVKEVDSDQVRETLAILMRHKRISAKHFSEFREAVEPSIAAHAVERATPDDIENLKQLLNEGYRFIKSGQNDFVKFYQWESNMHSELARISGNPIFEWISGTIVFNLKPYKKLLSLRRTRVDILDDWRDIIEAMENGEVMKAISIIRVHSAKYRRLMSNTGQIKKNE